MSYSVRVYVFVFECRFFRWRAKRREIDGETFRSGLTSEEDVVWSTTLLPLRCCKLQQRRGGRVVDSCCDTSTTQAVPPASAAPSRVPPPRSLGSRIIGRSLGSPPRSPRSLVPLPVQEQITLSLSVSESTVPKEVPETLVTQLVTALLVNGGSGKWQDSGSLGGTDEYKKFKEM